MGATSAMERANVPTVCSCCGREDLKKTVKLVSLATGDAVWFGTGCAARALGLGLPAFRAEAKRAQDAQDASDAAERQARSDAEFASWIAWLTARANGSPVLDFGGRVDIQATAHACGFPGVFAARAAYRAEVLS